MIAERNLKSSPNITARDTKMQETRMFDGGSGDYWLVNVMKIKTD
jgi:hypothetical protein